MTDTYHILNGDALKVRLADQLEGSIIVARECLVDGDVKANSKQEFHQLRATYLEQTYQESSEKYYKDVVPEFERIQSIPTSAKVYLWFEDDLFCQVNMWYVVSLLAQEKRAPGHVYVVRPEAHSLYGFAGVADDALISLQEQCIPIDPLDKMAQMWEHYRTSDVEALLQLAEDLNESYPFLPAAVKAHSVRPEYPRKLISEILAETNNREFGSVFSSFCRRAPIYGYGDVMVKRIYDQILIDESQ